VLLDGYVRVSQVGGRHGESFISPALQREQIQGWAKLHGALIGEVFEELDQSGGRKDRPLYLRAIERVEQGESEGVVVAKLDRWGRSLVDGLAAIERIRAAGGAFVSVQDGFDLSTDTGKLVLRLMLSMAEWELDRVRSAWSAARARAVANGRHISAWVPAGYQRSSDGRLRADPIAGPLIGELFQRRAAGNSARVLCGLLEDRGVVSAHGTSHWSVSGVRGLLANRVYLGEARSGSYVCPGAHEALIDPVTWQQAQRPRVLRAQPGRPKVLGTLLRCATCRHVMGCDAQAASGRQIVRNYRCANLAAGAGCQNQARIRSDLIEPYIEEVFFSLVKRHRRPGFERLDRLQERVVKTEARLAAYRDNPGVADALGSERYEEGLRWRRKQVDHALLAVGRARRAVSEPALPDPGQLAAAWPAMSVAERRQAISELIDCVFIRPGAGPVHERAFICRRGEAPVDLPMTGWPRRQLSPFRPAECEGAASKRRRPQPRAWSEERITKALRFILADYETWPTYEQFQLAGQARLYGQILGRGGTYSWALRTGIPIAHSARLVHRWDENMIRGMLDVLLRGRSAWPTRREFQAARLQRLERAIQDHGGSEHWAREYGLPRRPRGPRPGAKDA
jgi:DNA invertase Pin-like site-specific DNA recombinase